jgi:ABC-type transport system involved in cytochrome c biogenesis permease subunit
VSSTQIAYSLIAVYTIALIPGVAAAILRSKPLSTASVWAFAAAFAVNTAVLIGMWISAGRAPFSTLYETLLLYPWCVGVVTLVMMALYGLRVLIPLASAGSLIGLIWAATHPDLYMRNLPPALISVWFVPHVVTYFVAYAALAVSMKLAALSLVRPDWRAKESGASFEDYAHRAVMFGFTGLTLGLIMGGIWAKEAWGDYWSWDVKENWSLVSWLAYLTYLHMRYVKGWRGRPAMIVCIVSFAAVVFTYIGMNSLPTAAGSDHVY